MQFPKPKMRYFMYYKIINILHYRNQQTLMQNIYCFIK